MFILFEAKRYNNKRLEKALIKWERYAVDEVLQELYRKEDLEKVDRTDLLNSKVDFLNEKLKQVYIKMDRLLETKKETNSNTNLNPFVIQSAGYSIQTNPFSNIINRQEHSETPRVHIEREATSEVLSPERITIQNESKPNRKEMNFNENEFMKNFNGGQKKPTHTSKSILLNPKSDPDIISK